MATGGNGPFPVTTITAVQPSDDDDVIPLTFGYHSCCGDESVFRYSMDGFRYDQLHVEMCISFV